MKKNFFLFVFLALAGSADAADSVTLTTYYPAPAGSYQSMRSTRMCIGTNCHNGTAAAADNNLYVQGNVGIGTTMPYHALQVHNATGQGAISISGRSDTTTYSGLYLHDLTANATNTWVVAHLTSGNNLAIGYWTNPSTFTEMIDVATDGNVGIGVNSPVAKLDILGGIRIGSSPGACTAANDGTLRYTSANKLQYCDGAALAWQNAGGDTAVKGTLCGFEDASGTTMVVKCDGYSPATSCPTGYSKKQVAQVSGNELYSCIKQ